MNFDYETITTRFEQGVLTASIYNPPCNVISVALHKELADLEQRVRNEDTIRVLVLESSNKDFFLAHYDVAYAATRPAPPKAGGITTLNPFQETCVRLRENPTPILVKISGRAGGGGIELAASCDMRYGLRGRTVLNQMEVPLGILPGAGGCQNLIELMGRGRALEMILGGDDIDGETAASWGYLNRLFDTEEELDNFVDMLALRIASWPTNAVALAKAAVDLGESNWHQRLLEENRLLFESMHTPERIPLMTAFMEQGGQTPEGEKNVARMILKNAQ